MNPYELPSIDEDYDAGLEDDLFAPLPDDLPGFETPQADDAGWAWHDARLIGVDRGQDAGETRYEVGAIDLYSNPDTGDLGGSYLPIAAFGHDVPASAFYHDLQRQVHDAALAPHQVPHFAEQKAFEMQPEPQNWRGAEPLEYAAYERRHDLDVFDLAGADEPPDEAFDPLIEAAIELGGAALEPELEATPEATEAAFRALSAIGIQAENFDPDANPPPFHDPQTGIAYWVGVFVPEKDEREHCVASILSLGRSAETGEMEAQLAPCVPGDWDTAYNAAEHLIEVAQKGNIEQVFEAAEGMALASGTRELWEAERGLPLEADSAQEIAPYTQEIDL